VLGTASQAGVSELQRGADTPFIGGGGEFGADEGVYGTAFDDCTAANRTLDHADGAFGLRSLSVILASSLSDLISFLYTHGKDSCKTVTLGSSCFKMGRCSHKPPIICLESGIRRIRR